MWACETTRRNHVTSLKLCAAAPRCKDQHAAGSGPLGSARLACTSVQLLTRQKIMSCGDDEGLQKL